MSEELRPDDRVLLTHQYGITEEGLDMRNHLPWGSTMREDDQRIKDIVSRLSIFGKDANGDPVCTQEGSVSPELTDNAPDEVRSVEMPVIRNMKHSHALRAMQIVQDLIDAREYLDRIDNDRSATENHKRSTDGHKSYLSIRKRGRKA